MTGRKLARRRFEIGRAHVVRRRIDEVARQRHGFGNVRKLVAIEALRQFELDLVPIRLAVAREAVGAERHGERRKPRIVRLVGEAIDAVRQQLRQAAGQEQIPHVAVRLDAEQHAAETVLSRQQQMAPGLGFETRGVGKGAGLRIEASAHVGVGRRRDEPDRDRVRRPVRDEDGVHASCYHAASRSVMPRDDRRARLLGGSHTSYASFGEDVFCARLWRTP